ncbi:MAG TPA: TA system VapC family ribonuclease toxin [Candidatus Limnocylindrales bacterium]|nr:TA system VapC family ribonuclease toxin [Candidatus Limnocylindrales bacterium]
MIAIDTNLLVFAHRGNAPQHQAALAALQPVFEGTSAWALPWPCIHEFISVATNRGIYKPASTLPEALSFLEHLFGSPQLHLLSESPGCFDKLRELALAAKLSGPRIHDARIAALCLHHGVRELWTADRDFSMFPKLKTRNPLVKK